MKTLSVILLVSCTILSTVITGCGEKEEVNKTSQKESVEKKTQTQQETSTQNQSNTSASEVGKIWSQVEKINASLSKGINSGKIGHLEEPVSEIITLIKKMPEKSANLPAASLETIKTKTNELKKIGDKMDKYQHDNKTSEMKAEYLKFSQTLNDIKNIFPAGSF